MQFSTNPTDTTGINNSKYQLIPIGSNSSKKFENDFLFDALPDLVNEQFKPWYCRMFYKLGKDRVLHLASVARSDGKNPRAYFSKLLKMEAQRG